MPFGPALRAAGSTLAAPLLAAMLSKVLGFYAQYLTPGSLLDRTFTAAGEYWLFIAIVSGVIYFAAAGISEGGRF